MFWRLLVESFVRQRRRKALAGVAILLGTTAVTAMLALATTVGDRIHRELAVYGANIVVTPAADALELKVGGVNLKHPGSAYLKEADLVKLKEIFWANNIKEISPELPVSKDFRVVLQGKPPIPVSVVGMWFNHDFAGRKTGAEALHPSWRLNGRWPVLEGQGDLVPVVLGQRLAQRLGLHTGSVLALENPATGMDRQTSNETVQVEGVVSTGSALDDNILVALSTAQEMNGTLGAVSRVEISARTKPEDAFARKDPDTLSPKLREIWYCRPYANSIAYQIREAIPGARAEQVRQVEQSEGTVLQRISGLMWLISGAALLAAGFAVSAAMATAVIERRTEIGLMRSLGAGKAAIALLFYAEAGLLALLAGAVGYLAGSGLAAWLGARIFDDSPTQHGMSILSVFNPALLPVVVGLGLMVAIAGSTPSIRAALRMDPSAILREDG